MAGGTSFAVQHMKIETQAFQSLKVMTEEFLCIVLLVAHFTTYALLLAYMLGIYFQRKKDIDHGYQFNQISLL